MWSCFKPFYSITIELVYGKVNGTEFTLQTYLTPFTLFWMVLHPGKLEDTVLWSLFWLGILITPKNKWNEFEKKKGNYFDLKFWFILPALSFERSVPRPYSRSHNNFLRFWRGLIFWGLQIFCFGLGQILRICCLVKMWVRKGAKKCEGIKMP